MTREEAIKYIKSRCIGSAEERDGTQWSEAMWMAIEALSEPKKWECKDCTHWDKLDYEAPRQGWCDQFEDWTDADEYCSRCAKMRGEEEWQTVNMESKLAGK